MRNLLSCLAIAMFAGIIGCGEPAAPTAPPADAGSNTSGSETTSTSTGEMTSVSLNVPGMT